jgi:hypothetical protein
VPTPSTARSGARGLVQKACIDFAATFEQGSDTKFPNQEKATAKSQKAAQLDPQWDPIAADMALITSVGIRINITHDPTLTTDESNAGNQAVTDLQQRCTDAGAEFTLPPD